MRGDGDGWVTCGLGHRHWGAYGAAGLLVRSPARSGAGRLVLVQLRVGWSHYGGTWGLLGGARDSHESAVDTALREAEEEGGIDAGVLNIASVYHDDHGNWRYSTVIAETDTPFAVAPANAESDALRWVPEDEMTGLALHPHFAISWPTLRAAPGAPFVIIDAANVVGSRPDGWWRDRLSATRRLRDRLADLTERGLSPNQLSFLDVPHGTPDHWFADLLLVVEGAARPLATEAAPTGVRTVAAERSGDDQIVTLVERARHDPRPTVVVTADRALRQRCALTDPRTLTVGPSWLHALLDGR